MNEIFIFAQTRSGSTLLQRAINQTKDVTIYGEHGGLLNGYAAAYYAALNAGLNDSRFKPEVLKDPKGFAPCVSCIEPSMFRMHTYSYLTKVLNPENTPRWGFKEVRYQNGRVFYLLAELFPTAKFVFLVRDPREQIQSVVSMEWETFASAYSYWLSTVIYFSNCQTACPDRCRFITYRQLRNVRPLFDWLGLDNSMNNLFRQMPRTGETETKIKLDSHQNKMIKLQCLPLFERVKYEM